MSTAQLTGKEHVLLCINASLKKKAENVVILNVKTLSSFTDYFIICSGSSDRQVQAIASSIQENLKEVGIMPLGIEGEKSGKWILMDYDDVIIHIFHEPVRKFYEIERLWSDAPQMQIESNVIELHTLGEGM